jgi:GTP cyclohydrolase I
MPAERNGKGAALHLESTRVAAGTPAAARLPCRLAEVSLPADGAGELASLIQRQLELLGEDAEREGLRRTPDRVAESLRWLTRGYAQDVRQVVGDGVFDDTYENMVMVRDVELFSLCEHHMLPFFGKVHVAYIPAGRILGLSKVARIVEVFARRFQVQERLTEQIADALMQVLQPRGVGVVIEAQHLCMMMRGVEKQNSSTVTSALRGSFRDEAATREEFLRLAYR